jgi:hypothetical protein
LGDVTPTPQENMPEEEQFKAIVKFTEEEVARTWG